MTTPTRAPNLRVGLVASVFLVVVSPFLSGCGANQTQLQSDLVGTEWVVVEMTGFPDDNVVGGKFDFTNQRFRYFDGNHTSTHIEWNVTGFTVNDRGDSTAMAPPDDEPGRYLGNLVPVGARVEIVQNTDGSITLTQGDLTVTAEPD
ncbi:MAG: hypothetical protein F4Z58_03935 [Acidimicrobiaceae bacterium]|nr:hypothetical protein [Acidimicrobiaceae bacterium]MXW75178.1 hypothetical protein [Acidimicrobiaceae bacterium]MYD06259.1 hypothetical protein [Acidimicrobiaceae bacterium]MYI59352.1 hypothetical protein [Acidimicrobiaceae bacterium]